ncbi:hypothetical protein DXM27_15500 [Rhizobium rhizogenes]|uniref:Uncharacterized protein n=1 Tax=Rhizobium rhizogenes TaxID=359 RepID=A0AA88EY89_RHIRH|nr:hypothetical protein DXM27_15500 [Rhizobium rhizogenes]
MLHPGHRNILQKSYFLVMHNARKNSNSVFFFCDEEIDPLTEKWSLILEVSLGSDGIFAGKKICEFISNI